LFGISQLLLLAIAGGALVLGLGLRRLNVANQNVPAL